MTVQRNVEVRELIKSQKIYSYEVAEKLGIHETTFYRMLRKELTDEKKQEILAAIEELKQENSR